MRAFISLLSLIAAGIVLSGCGKHVAVADGLARVELTPAQKTKLVYAPVRLTASLCASGRICKDLNVAANVKKAIPIADEIVDKAVAQMNADPARSNVEKWTTYALDGIEVLSKVLDAYEVKG